MHFVEKVGEDLRLHLRVRNDLVIAVVCTIGSQVSIDTSASFLFGELADMREKRGAVYVNGFHRKELLHGFLYCVYEVFCCRVNVLNGCKRGFSERWVLTWC